MFKFKRSVSFLCITLFLLVSFVNPVTAENDTVLNREVKIEETEELTYEEYLSQYKGEQKPFDDITITSDNIVAEQSSDYDIQPFEQRNNVCVINGDNSKVTYSFNVRKQGMYQLKLSQIGIDEGKIIDPQFDVLIDGKIPYSSAKSVTISRNWVLKGDKRYDSRGNEQLRSWTEEPYWFDCSIYDCEGRFNDPLYFYFSAGVHTITLDFEYSGLAIEKLTFYNSEEPQLYSGKDKNAADANEIIIEAEDFSHVSDSTIALNIEKNDPGVKPNSAYSMKYNTVGGNSFAKSGQKIFWNLKVEKSGYYYVAFKARQNIKKGYFSSRRFQIDGVTPYMECENIQFTYSADWQQFVLTTPNGEPMLFYFDKGKNHELSLECIPGQLSDSMTKLEESIKSLNHIFLEVRMVVGNSSDKYRDYYLKEDIPTLSKEVASVLNQLEKQKDLLQSVSGTNGGDLSSLQTMIIQLKQFNKNVDEIALKLDSFKSNISSLSAWVSDLKTQPLELDRLTVFSNDSQLQSSKSNFFKKMFFNFQRLILSFSEDYGVVGDYSDKQELKVWVSTGQDQLDIIRNLITDKYQENVAVKIQLVPTGLLEAAMAGKGPDVAMFIAGDMPVNLASRGGLVDLSELENYSDVINRYMKNATLPFTYNGGCYALPLTQGFNMLFVRTDIFKEMGLSVPDTWDDFFNLLPVLQRNNLEAGIPADLSTFATFAIQKGGTFYNEDLTTTTFDKLQETSAFIQWTELFTEKGLPLAYDFSNRFRTGEMPIGISDYSVYAMLETSAPEISGRWEMFPIMATSDGEGNLNRSVCSAAMGSVGLQQGNTCAVILKDCKNVNAAWDFLQWFTNTENQTTYGLELEKRMGVSARYTPANKEVLKNLPWTKAEQSLLYEQWNNLVLLPEIPGSYYVTRNINNAFRKVVYNHENPTHTLNKYNEVINQEIQRKRKGLNKGVS